jgi:anti-sigma factor RsiW
VLEAYLADRPDVADALAEVEAMKDPRRRFEESVAFGDLTFGAVPDRGPAELEAERAEARTPFPTLTGRAIDFGG